MPNHERNGRTRWLRRSAFTAALLLISPATVWILHYLQTPGPGLPPLWTVCWGFDSIGMVLALWLVARVGLFGNSIDTWLRPAIYVLAYLYGRMLFDATQEAMTNPAERFRWPGLSLDDYGRPAIDLPWLVVQCLVAWPVARAAEFSLGDRNAPRDACWRVSIQTLLLATTLVASVVAWVQWLTTESAPRTGFSGGDPATEVLEYCVSAAVGSIGWIIGALAIGTCVTRSLWLAVASTMAAFVVDLSVTTGGFALIGAVTGVSMGGVLAGDIHEAAWYILGRSLMSICALVIAKWLGISCEFKKSRPEQQESPTPDRVAPNSQS